MTDYTVAGGPDHLRGEASAAFSINDEGEVTATHAGSLFINAGTSVLFTPGTVFTLDQLVPAGSQNPGRLTWMPGRFLRGRYALVIGGPTSAPYLLARPEDQNRGRGPVGRSAGPARDGPRKKGLRAGRADRPAYEVPAQPSPRHFTELGSPSRSASDPLRTIVLFLLAATLALAEPVAQFSQPVVDGATFMEWSSTGKRILTHDDRRLWVHDLETMKTHAFEVKRSFYMAELDPGERLLAVTGYPETLQVYDWRTGQQLWAFQGPQRHEYGSYAPAFSPDGRFLMIASSSMGRDRPDPWVRVFEARSGKPVRKWSWLSNHEVSVAWAPDGAILKSDGKFLASFDLGLHFGPVRIKKRNV